MHLSRPEWLEDHGLAQALLSFFFITTNYILTIRAIVALGHDTNPIIGILVTRHMLIELVFVELYEAMRPEYTFLLVFLSLLVSLFDGLLCEPALVVLGVIDQLLVRVLSMAASILIQLSVLVLGAESTVRYVMIGRVLRVILILILFISNLHVDIIGLAFGV